MKQQNVHSYRNKNGEDRWAVCVWVESAAQFQAPLDKATAEATGCHTEFAKVLDYFGGYKTLAAARRRARTLFGYVRS